MQVMQVSRGEFIRRLPSFGEALSAVGFPPARRAYIREAKVMILGRSPSDQRGLRPSVPRVLRVDQHLPGCFGKSQGDAGLIGHNSVQIPHDGVFAELSLEAVAA